MICFTKFSILPVNHSINQLISHITSTCSLLQSALYLSSSSASYSQIDYLLPTLPVPNRPALTLGER